MNDFLSRLIVRNSEQAEVIQPRPVSYYALAPQQWDVPVAESAETRETITPVSHATHLPAQAKAGSEVQSPALPVRPATPTLVSVEPAETHSPSNNLAQEIENQPRREPRARQVVVERMIEREATPPVSVSQTSAPLKPTNPRLAEPASPAVIQHNESTVLIQPQVEVIEQNTLPVDSHMPKLRREVVQPPLPAPTAPRVAEARPAALTHAPAARPLLVPAPLPAVVRPLPVMEKKSDAAPAIQVSIGRIEVRATPPPVSATRTPRPATPPTNLEDYLRQRSSHFADGGHP
jgi:hypothetical protein